jgi:hypothetical protein
MPGGKVLRAIVLVVGAMALPSASLAHHSRAAYDLTKEVLLEGTVTELLWKNPHIFVTVETLAADGGTDRTEV